MSIINVSRAASFKTSDGSSFPTREEAIKHEKFTRRFNALTDLFAEHSFTISEEEVREIARVGDAVIGALTVKANRGPGKKDEAPAAA